MTGRDAAKWIVSELLAGAKEAEDFRQFFGEKGLSDYHSGEANALKWHAECISAGIENGSFDGDEVLVTRCKDCRHAREYAYIADKYYCPIHDRDLCDGDFFCGFGTPKEQEE